MWGRWRPVVPPDNNHIHMTFLLQKITSKGRKGEEGKGGDEGLC